MKPAQAVKEWKDEARAETRQEDLLHILEVRFPGTLPTELLARIHGQTGVHLLKQWLRSARIVHSLEEFIAATQ